MKRQWLVLGVLAFALTGLLTPSIQADFVQCPGGNPVALTDCKGPEGTTDIADVINGTNDPDEINAQDGNDIVFGRGGNDLLRGQVGNDVLFGGPGSDNMRGTEGNDTFLPGPDSMDAIQETDGGADTDQVIVLVGEITYCMIVGVGLDTGRDTVTLVGFGPYNVEKPFGLAPGFGSGWIQVVDPITNGIIVIRVEEGDDSGNERIFGLISPNVTFIDTLPGECVIV